MKRSKPCCGHSCTTHAQSDCPLIRCRFCLRANAEIRITLGRSSSRTSGCFLARTGCSQRCWCLAFSTTVSGRMKYGSLASLMGLLDTVAVAAFLMVGEWLFTRGYLEARRAANPEPETSASSVEPRSWDHQEITDQPSSKPQRGLPLSADVGMTEGSAYTWLITGLTRPRMYYYYLYLVFRWVSAMVFAHACWSCSSFLQRAGHLC